MYSLEKLAFLKQASARLEGIMFLLKTDNEVKIMNTWQSAYNVLFMFSFVTYRIRSRKESAVCTTPGSPLEGSGSSLDEIPGWIETARRIPVEAAMIVVTM